LICAWVEKTSDDLRTSCSSTSTAPAITKACALVRESANPRSTRSLSMRSRCMRTSYQKPLERTHPACGTPASMPAITINCEQDAHEPPNRCRSSLCHLPGVQNRARSVDEAQLGRAFFAQPDHNSRRIRPDKRGDISGTLHSVVA